MKSNHPLARWASTFEEQVRDGSMSLTEVVEIAVSELEQFNMICPSCAKDSVRSGTAGYRHGECLACHFYKLRDAHNAKLRELKAKRANDTAKQQVKRLRESLDEIIDEFDEDEFYDELDEILEECE